MNINRKILGFCFGAIFFLNAQDENVIKDQAEVFAPDLSNLSTRNFEKQVDGSVSQEVQEQKITDPNNIEQNQNSVELEKQIVKAPEIQGADNVNLSENQIGVQGNWVKKREWLKSSYVINDEIQNIVAQIQTMPKQYKDQFDLIDKQLDEFYKTQGFNQANSASMFGSIKKYLDNRKKFYKEQLKSGVTTQGEIDLDELLREIKDLKHQSEQLRLDIKSIYDLDRSIDERLKKLDELVKLAYDESNKASLMVEEIWNIIDDKKARTIYYQLKGDSLEKVNAIKKYVTQTLWQDFTNFIELMKTQMSKVSTSITELESKGLVIKDRAERLKDIKKVQEEEAKRLEELAQAKKKSDNMFWYQKLYEYIVDIFAKIYNFLSK